MMIDNNFKIPEKPWWNNSKSVNEIISRIDYLKYAVRKEVLGDPQYCQGYTEFHHERYVMECIVGECNYKITPKHIEKILNTNCLQLLYYWIFYRNWYYLVIKIQNLFKTVVKLFPSCFLFTTCPQEDFHIEFVKAVHREIGKGIISNAGEFRKNSAAPAGEYMFEYMEPHLIEDNLKQLLRDCKMIFTQNTELNLLDLVKYGACFLERFLYIHPFSNGNGRTARLLLSRLLQKFTIVPLSLYTTGKRRELYLSCLREGHYKDNKPSLLARFILEAMEKDYETYCYVMDIDLA